MRQTRAVRITLNDLRRVTTGLLDHLEETAGAEFELDAGSFWNVPTDRVFDFERFQDEPIQLDIGDLNDKWPALLHAANSDPEDEDNGFILYDLIWLGDVLRAIGITQHE